MQMHAFVSIARSYFPCIKSVGFSVFLNEYVHYKATTNTHATTVIDALKIMPNFVVSTAIYLCMFVIPAQNMVAIVASTTVPFFTKISLDMREKVEKKDIVALEQN
jgi:hypothetical protein